MPINLFPGGIIVEVSESHLMLFGDSSLYAINAYIDALIFRFCEYATIINAKTETAQHAIAFIENPQELYIDTTEFSIFAQENNPA